MHWRGSALIGLSWAPELGSAAQQRCHDSTLRHPAPRPRRCPVGSGGMALRRATPGGHGDDGGNDGDDRWNGDESPRERRRDTRARPRRRRISRRRNPIRACGADGSGADRPIDRGHGGGKLSTPREPGAHRRRGRLDSLPRRDPDSSCGRRPDPARRDRQRCADRSGSRLGGRRGGGGAGDLSSRLRPRCGTRQRDHSTRFRDTRHRGARRQP